MVSGYIRSNRRPRPKVASKGKPKPRAKIIGQPKPKTKPRGKYPLNVLHKFKYADFVRAISKLDIGPVCGDRNHSLRHDVDHDMWKALIMAKIENELGLCSTYYVLHTSPYYRNKNFIADCKKIQELGHEVGLHNNIFTEHLTTGTPVKDILEDELIYLRESGLDIRGVSSHGDRKCREFGYRNYEIFEECQPSYRERSEVITETVKLSDYGLYESYFVDWDLYVSDTGSAWRVTDFDEWHPDFLKVPTIRDVNEIIEKILSLDVRLQISTHPCWWNV